VVFVAEDECFGGDAVAAAFREELTRPSGVTAPWDLAPLILADSDLVSSTESVILPLGMAQE
jgi:hypothetical protein